MRPGSAVLFGASLLVVTAPASAQWSSVADAEPEPVPMTPGPSPAPRVATRGEFEEPVHDRPARWYGGETLVILGINDAALLAGFALTVSDNHGAPLFVGASVGHVFAGPIVHFVHGHVGTGFGALGLTLGIAALTSVAGLGIGAAADHNCSDFCFGPTIGAVFGAAAGGYLGPFFDVALFSREPASESDRSFAILPFADAHGGGLRVGGAF